MIAFRPSSWLWTVVLLTPVVFAADQPWVVYEGGSGLGTGKKIVLISGDEEYRSEEALPQLGKILAVRHGFHCTVLFAIDPQTGAIQPEESSNIPGLEALQSADLMIIATRFRDLPSRQMQYIVEYLESGRPILGMRTATHAFNVKKYPEFAKYSYNSKEPGWAGGFGKQVLGETWVAHHGHHGREATRGIVAPQARQHPITRGIGDGDIFGPTDVYAVTRPLPDDCQTLILGQVVAGMSPGDPAVIGKKNDPMMPIAWTRVRVGANGQPARIFTTTMGAATDLESAGFRRLLVNAACWCVGLEAEIPSSTNVDVVGEFKPSPFGFRKYQVGVMPAEHAR